MTFSPETLSKFRNFVFMPPEYRESSPFAFTATDLRQLKTPSPRHRIDKLLTTCDSLAEDMFDVWDQVQAFSDDKIRTLEEIQKRGEVIEPAPNPWKQNAKYLQGKQRIELKKQSMQTEEIQTLIEGNRQRLRLPTNTDPKKLAQQSKDLLQNTDRFSTAKAQTATGAPRHKRLGTRQHPSLKELASLPINEILSYRKRGFGQKFNSHAELFSDDRELTRVRSADRSSELKYTDDDMLQDMQKLKQEQLQHLLNTVKTPPIRSKYIEQRVSNYDYREIDFAKLSPKHQFIHRQMKKFQYGKSNEFLQKQKALKDARMAQIQPTNDILFRAKRIIDSKLSRQKHIEKVIRHHKTSANRLDNKRRQGFAELCQRKTDRLTYQHPTNESDKYILGEILKEVEDNEAKLVVDSTLVDSHHTSKTAGQHFFITAVKNSGAFSSPAKQSHASK